LKNSAIEDKFTKLNAIQDIQAEEAKRDWHGQEAMKIQRLIDGVATDTRDETEIQVDVNAYGDDDDLSEEEFEELHALTRCLKQVKQVYPNFFGLHANSEILSLENERSSTNLSKYTISE
jgi:hypothetical protein